MRKIIVICLLVLAVGILLYKHAETAILKEIPSDHLIVFSQEGCYHCHDALTYIDKKIRPSYPHLTIDVLDIRKNKDNYTKLMVYARHYHVADNQLGTPFIIYGNKYLMGWNEQKEHELMDLLKK